MKNKALKQEHKIPLGYCFVTDKAKPDFLEDECLKIICERKII